MSVITDFGKFSNAAIRELQEIQEYDYKTMSKMQKQGLSNRRTVHYNLYLPSCERNRNSLRRK